MKWKFWVKEKEVVRSLEEKVVEATKGVKQISYKNCFCGKCQAHIGVYVFELEDFKYFTCPVCGHVNGVS